MLTNVSLVSKLYCHIVRVDKRQKSVPDISSSDSHCTSHWQERCWGWEDSKKWGHCCWCWWWHVWQRDVWEAEGSLQVRDGAPLLQAAPGHRNDGEVSCWSDLSWFMSSLTIFQTQSHGRQRRPEVETVSVKRKRAKQEWWTHVDRVQLRLQQQDSLQQLEFSQGHQGSKVKRKSNNFLNNPARWQFSRSDTFMMVVQIWRAQSYPSVGDWHISTVSMIESTRAVLSPTERILWPTMW